MAVDAENVVLRAYLDSDYGTCERLVSNAWAFEANFPPEQMTRLAGYLYTMGSVAASNFRRVVEVQGEVVGFLFGSNENEPIPKHELQRLLPKLVVLKRLFFIKGMSFNEKMDLFKAMGLHEANRAKLVERGKSEIVLFVVDPEHQRAGYGKQLFDEFKAYCAQSGVQSIVVETNKQGASSFYEHIGFTHLGDFDSPLHEYATKGGQACMYEYLL
jgi:ribosomal protein S18 acetylase RimI-like enzyme